MAGRSVFDPFRRAARQGTTPVMGYDQSTGAATGYRDQRTAAEETRLNDEASRLQISQQPVQQTVFADPPEAYQGIVRATQGNANTGASMEREGPSEIDILRERARLDDEAFQRRMAAMNSLPPIGSGAAGSTAINAKEKEARDAAFASAKDKQGQLARARVNSLRGVMSDRGFLGSGEEAAGMGGIVDSAGDNMGEFVRDQLMMDADRAANIADRDQAHALTRRGQDINYRQSLLALLQSQRY